MVEPEEREKINLEANYLKPVFLAFIIQSALLIALCIYLIIDLIIDIANILTDNPYSLPLMSTFGFIFMGVAILIIVIPFVFFGLKLAKIKKQEEVPEFNEFGEKLFWDKGVLSWIFFLAGMAVCIIGFFQSG